MAGTNFTKDQLKAINTLDKSVLVSAAAGSGKTAVLVERIIRIILEGKADVDEMLVVTFTNAAASEMKLKLVSAIKKAMAEDPSKRAVLSRQLDMMYKSYISTFHSFAIRVIKEFFYMVDVEPGFAISDDVQATLLQREALEEIFEERFADMAAGGTGAGSASPLKHPGSADAGEITFADFLDRYSSDRNDEGLMDEIISSYKKLRSMPDYFAWAYEKAGDMKTAGGKPKAVDNLMEHIRSELGYAHYEAESVVNMLEENGLVKLAATAAKDAAMIQGLIDEADNAYGGKDPLEVLRDPEFARMAAGKEEKDTYNEIKPYVTRLRDSYKARVKNIALNYLEPGLDVRIAEQDDAYRYTIFYLDLLREFDERFYAKKKEQGLLDFSDIEHIAEAILDDKEAASVLRNRFKYIFIDEYQDTNPLQEHLIRSFAREDNVFKVGDVKQSIYRFRQSEPQIFIDTEAEYEDPGNDSAETVYLNTNFRSSGSTINYINAVFGEIMPGYTEREALHKGLDSDEKYDLVPEVHLLIKSQEAEEKDVPKEYEEMTELDAEAAHIAGEVRKIIGTEFYDSKRGIVRPAEARDIVILVRNSKPTVYLQRALAGIDVDSHINDDEGYFDTVEIKIATALLSAIDNMKRDVSLIAVLRSEIFGFTPDELGEIRAFYSEAGFDKSEYYCNAFRYYLENGEGELKEKAIRANRRIEGWKMRADMMPLDDFVWEVLTDSGYYLYAGAMYGGKQRQANLRILVERARSYKSTGISSLGDFIRYLDILKKKDVKTGQAVTVSEDDNVVRIMTIHKSKGLEFPFVILGMTGKQLNKTKRRKEFMFDPRIGVSLPYVDPDRKFWRMTIMQNMIFDKSHAEEFEEELRVLYVAMTRARNKLIITGIIKNEEKLIEKVHGENSYIEVIGESVETPFNIKNVYEIGTESRRSRQSGIEDFIEKRRSGEIDVSAELAAEIERRLGYVYPDEEALTIKSKYSVSELRKEKVSEELDAPRAKRFGNAQDKQDAIRAGGSAAVTQAEIGTAYHRIMEYVDVKTAIDRDGNYRPEQVAKAASELLQNGAIRQEVYDKLDLDVIANFYGSSLGARARKAAENGRLWKEKPFTMRTMHGDREVLVQGIIDLLFEEDGDFVLVDYKSRAGGIRKAGPGTDAFIRETVEEYRPQLEMYKEAVELGTDKRVKEVYLYIFNVPEPVAVDM